MVEAIPTAINGKWTLLLPEHRAVRPEWPVWEQERLASMHENIKPGDIVFDIGAEEGDFPALFTSWGADVIPFEPNPRVWPNIRFIWEANGFAPPRAYFAGFAANRTDYKPTRMEPIFGEPERDGWPACAYGPIIGDHGFRNVSERAHDTPSVRIDDFCNSTTIFPDLITMDVEGAELEVVLGAEMVLRHVHPLVYISIHPTFMVSMYPYTDADLHAFMREMGYKGTHIITDHEEHWLFR